VPVGAAESDFPGVFAAHHPSRFERGLPACGPRNNAHRPEAWRAATPRWPSAQRARRRMRSSASPSTSYPRLGARHRG